MTDITIRRLSPEDWPCLRAIRLLALRTEPGVFSGSLEAAEAQPASWWQALTTGTPHQAFGAFAGADMVGLVTAFTWNDDPTGGTAFLGMLFVAASHRGQGLASRLMAAAMAWVRAQPRFHRAIVGHRDGNVASMRAIQRQGFVVIRRSSKIWPDGGVADEVDYALEWGRE